MPRQPSNAHEFHAWASFWALHTSACCPAAESFFQSESSCCRLRCFVLGFSCQYSPVSSSVICTFAHRRWFADDHVVLLRVWSCACTVLGNALFRRIVYLPGYHISFHTLVLSVQVRIQKHLFPTWLLLCLHVGLWATLYIGHHPRQSLLAQQILSFITFPTCRLNCFRHVRHKPFDHVLSQSSCASCTTSSLLPVWQQHCCFSWELGAAAWYPPMLFCPVGKCQYPQFQTCKPDLQTSCFE